MARSSAALAANLIIGFSPRFAERAMLVARSPS
jgi:hypothetical protein